MSRARACGLTLFLGAALSALAGEPAVALRAESFTVPPATGPVFYVDVENRSGSPCQGTLAVRPPEGWQLHRAEQALSLGPNETKRVAFAIQKATNRDDNAYPVQVVATLGGSRVVREQTVVCASAPYFKPRIDGRAGDWDDAIPVTFAVKGRKTVVRTFWNRDEMAFLVEVDEARLVGYRKAAEFDAVQIAVAPREARTGTKPAEEAARYEFLLVASGSFWSRDKCFLLAKPGVTLAATQERRGLAPLQLKDAKLSVRRRRGVTAYECAIPLSAMPEIKATEGREFCLSFLVHDPDGTGVRDWGEAAGLWPWQRNRLAWSDWPGARWQAAPFDGKVEWGFCSSKH